MMVRLRDNGWSHAMIAIHLPGLICDRINKWMNERIRKEIKINEYKRKKVKQNKKMMIVNDQKIIINKQTSIELQISMIDRQTDRQAEREREKERKRHCVTDK